MLEIGFPSKLHLASREGKHAVPVVGRPFICAHQCHAWLRLPCLSRSSRTRRAGKARIVPSIGRKRKTDGAAPRRRAGRSSRRHSSRSARPLPRRPQLQGPEVREVGRRSEQPDSRGGVPGGQRLSARQPGAIAKKPLGTRRGPCMMSVDRGTLPPKSVQQTGAVCLVQIVTQGDDDAGEVEC